MFITIESYPEFIEDIKNDWKDIIKRNNFKLEEIEEGEVIMYNDKLKISFLLDVYTRMGYVIENIKTGQKYNQLSLHLFKNIPMVYNSFEDENYPLSQKEWFNLLAEDDYRAICLIDIPIIRDEIMEKWPELIAGDFSREEEYMEWDEWSSLESNKRKSFDELTNESYLKQKV